MTLEETRKIYESICSSKWDVLVDQLTKSAVQYARIRVDYKLATPEERREMEDTRTLAHNAFIDSCNILSRNMYKAGEDNTWWGWIGDDRKAIGDFACYLHCLLGILAR